MRFEVVLAGSKDSIEAGSLVVVAGSLGAVEADRSLGQRRSGAKREFLGHAGDVTGLETENFVWGFGWLFVGLVGGLVCV